MNYEAQLKHKEEIELANCKSLYYCAIKMMGLTMSDCFPCGILSRYDGTGELHFEIGHLTDPIGGEVRGNGPAIYFSILLAKSVEAVVNNMSDFEFPSLANSLDMFVGVDGKINSSLSDSDNIAFDFAQAIDGGDGDAAIEIALVFDRTLNNIVGGNSELVELIEDELMRYEEVCKHQLWNLVCEYDSSVIGCLVEELSPLFQCHE